MVFRRRVRFTSKVGYGAGRAGRTHRARPRSVKAVAKRVVNTTLARRIERKRFTLSFADLAMGATTFYFVNPIQHIPQGVDDNQRIGDKMTNVRLQLGLEYYHVGTAPLGAQLWQGSVLRVIVFKSRRQVPTVVNAWTSKNPTDVSGFPLLFAEPFHGSMSPINTHDYTVLRDVAIKSSTPDGGGTFGVPRTIRMSIPLAKEWRYLDGDVYGKFNNIYVLVVASAVNGSNTDTVGQLQASGYLSWADA